MASACTDVLVVFARAPRAGAVKTRLGATVGDARALAIHRTLTERTLGTARGCALPIVVAYTPAGAHDEMKEWLGADVCYAEQSDGDLGRRMSSAIAALVAGGARRVVVIGTDCPTISPSTVHAALDALALADVVLGPATDGGYYLVAVRSAHAALFDDIPWSSERTLAVTLDRARQAGLHVALLPEMRDVDTDDDWQWHLRQRTV